MQVFQTGTLGKNASRDVLKDMVHNLLTLLLDNRVEDLEEGSYIIRSVNIMTVKIVEKADTTNIMRCRACLFCILFLTYETAN